MVAMINIRRKIIKITEEAVGDNSCSKTQALSLPIILSLLIFCSIGNGYPLIEPDDLEFWEEYEDKNEVEWDKKLRTLNLQTFTIYQLIYLFNLDYESAAKVIQEMKSANSGLNEKESKQIELNDIVTDKYLDEPKRKESRLHVKTNRRFGEATDADRTRYEGSEYGITQKYWMKYYNIQAGALMDKDPFEPRINDLNRFWCSWRKGSFKAVAGDFHVTAGAGLGIWTYPVYYDSFDSHSVFRRTPNGIQPANDAMENANFTGVAVEKGWNSLQAGAFAARTKLDAIVDPNSEDILRISNGGLHRTAGERIKQNSLNEESFGSFINYEFYNRQNHEIILSVNGYYSIFNPELKPESDARNRFPLNGDRTGAIAGGLRVTTPGFSILMETASDYFGNIAYQGGLSREFAKFDTKFDFLFYRYPVAFHNHRARSTSSGVMPEDASGAALAATMNIGSDFLEKVKAHTEIEMQSWRGYSIPTPRNKRKTSLELYFKPMKRDLLRVRFRRSGSDLGHGENEEVEIYSDNRLRLSYYFCVENRLFDTLKLFTEGVSRISSIHSRESGWMLGVDGKIRMQRLSIYLMSVLFNTESEPALYLGEAKMPDRFRSVRLNGNGLRWSLNATWRSGRWNWFSLETAKTGYFRAFKKSDLEVFLSASIYFSD